MRLAHRAGLGEPGRRVDEREHAALGAAPVLGEHRTPPLDHLVLGGGRDRRGAVQHGARATTGRRPPAPPRAGAAGARTSSGTRWLLRTARSWMSCEALRLVPARHDHQRAAVGEVDGREAERRGVVERPGDEVRALAVEPEHHARPRRRAPASSPRLRLTARASRPSAARWCPTCRASCRRRVRRARTARRSGGRPAPRGRGRPRPPRPRAPASGRGLPGDGLVLGIGEQDRRGAVVEDVGDLGCGEVPVDGRDPGAGVLGGHEHVDELDPVAHAAWPRARRPARRRRRASSGRGVGARSRSSPRVRRRVRSSTAGASGSAATWSRKRHGADPGRDHPGAP